MNFNQFRYILIGLLIFLTSCATTQTTVNRDTLTKIKRIGVISLVAHEFYRKYTGLTAFGNEREKHDISAWHVDDEYELQMQSALAKLGLFEVVHVPYDREEFYSVYDIDGPWDAPAFRKEWVNIEDKLRAFAGNNSLDAVIVVIWGESGDFLAHTNQLIRGAGFYSRGIGDSTSVSALHLLCRIAVIDGHTGKPVAIRWVRFTQNIAPELARTKFADFNEAKIAEIRAMLVSLPKDQWESKFKELFEIGVN